MSDETANSSRSSSLVVAMIIASLGVLGLAELAVYLPAAARKILLFSMAFGVAAGFIVLLVAGNGRIPKRIAVPLTALLIMVGLSLIAIRSFFLLRDVQAEANREKPQGMFDAAIAEQLADYDPTLAESLKQRRRRHNPTFGDYLAIRLQPLGEWTQPWPALFWGGEIVFATLAGVFVVHRRLASTTDETIDKA